MLPKRALPKGTCKICGYAPGFPRCLTYDEHMALQERGFTLLKDNQGNDMAMLSRDNGFSFALKNFHDLGHPIPRAKIKTALERLRDDPDL